MKRLDLFIILLLSTHLTSVNAQSKLNTYLIGEWKAAKVYDMGAVIPDDPKKSIELFRTRFLGSKFVFKADHSFAFTSPIAEMKINNARWKILEDNGEVIIEEWQDKSILMGINVLMKDGKTIFMMEETFLAFEMEKVK